ncbi:MAG: M35 family metallo-endopeptidase, partial [Myxococcaceae bacterium]|nr:M35 family metallo-endopeptidase [Myxococcaceae bacterium]
MSKSRRGHFWSLAGWMVGLSLLGACGAPEADIGDEMLAGVEDLRELDASGVTVQVSAAKSALAASDSVAVNVTLTNGAAHAVRLLKWYTPAEDVEEALFAVTRDGEPVEFLGPHYKRPAPRLGDYLRLAPGESLTRTVDLAAFYDVSKTGTYRVRYAVEATSLAGATPRQVGQLASNELTLWVEGRPSGLARDDEQQVTAQLTSSITYSKCDSTQQSTMLQALNAASAMADDSVAYLNGTPGSTPRYTTWFGAYSSGGWNTAKTHFIAIKDAFDTKPLALDCGCKKTYYAYVYPTQPYKIYVCKAFWTAPMTGTDSKGGTLIHEMSHFNV